MRLRGTNFVRKHMDKKIQSQAIETMDGILWSINEDNKTAKIKIQGSNSLVTAHYPRNFSTRPYWLKPNNAVRVTFKSGQHGYVELTSEGRAIPSPVAGPLFPPEGILPSDNSILSGLNVEVADVPPIANSSIIIHNGIFLIDGVSYSISAESTTIDLLNYYPTSHTYRYVSIVVGKDLQFDVIIASESNTGPQKPLIPTDHVLICSVLLVKDKSLLSWMINGLWLEESPTLIECTYPEHVNWQTANTTLTFQVKDQYGNFVAGNYTFYCRVMYGGGYIVEDTGLGYEMYQGQYYVKHTVGSSYTSFFTYFNDWKSENLHSPMINVAVTNINGINIQNVFMLTLHDQDERPLI